MECKSITEVVEQKINGLYYGNRVLLPFKADFLKVVIDDNVITDFSNESEYIEVIEEGYFTSLYFLGETDITEIVSKYETIKIIAADRSDNIFDIKNHKMLSLTLEEPHTVIIQFVNDNMLFIE